jgi:phosphate transport system permease protein
MAAGLVLFGLTFVVNAVARVVIERRKAFIE